MPVEIKELVIRAVVNDDAQSSAGSEESEQSSGFGGGLDNDTVIQECVRQVMQLLARNRER